MSTTVITGRDLALTIDSKSYDAQAKKVELTNAPVIDIYQTLDGKAYKHTDDQWTLNVDMLADWGATGSLCEALWTAADTAPNTALTGSLTAVTGAVFAISVLPVFPPVSGTAPSAQEISLSFTVVGTPADTFS
jgi:hypothetical protein